MEDFGKTTYGTSDAQYIMPALHRIFPELKEVYSHTHRALCACHTGCGIERLHYIQLGRWDRMIQAAS
ncbi:hypothetical protein Y1Q_0001053 [Alligator mississippiensis]|uniref:Uncharacterized protein n=1 Tax=Alligator mississippiensis TaxID=8496 RepID=A0A151NET1_ALLMI|nr:hypothetical protein Y1Q_0001053 [Alligator mississippiensis]